MDIKNLDHVPAFTTKDGSEIRELLALAYMYELPALSFAVTEIVLMRSELHPAGAEYTPIVKACLSQ